MSIQVHLFILYKTWWWMKELINPKHVACICEWKNVCCVWLKTSHISYKWAVHNKMYSIKFKDFSFSHWEIMMRVLKVVLQWYYRNSLILRSAAVESVLFLRTVCCVAITLGVVLLMYCAISRVWQILVIHESCSTHGGDCKWTSNFTLKTWRGKKTILET
jgi:hypothetical protein